MLQQKKIAFLGAGSMAEAMISGITAAKKISPQQITVSNNTNKERLHSLEKTYGIRGITRENLHFDDIDIIILAMKPKDAETALYSIRELLQPHQLILSVLAGITTEFLEKCLPAGQQVIRVMPNTSSMIRESATAICAGKHTSKQNMALAAELLEGIGEVYIIHEEQMDTFTGIAGSGPAYFYLLMEHMEKEGVNAGFPLETVRQMIAQTILGAAKMVQETGESPAVLRENVTSPNGTTAAGLATLEAHGGGTAITEAVKQAAYRSKEISSELEKMRTGVIR